ncbi:MAG: sigma-70 family RNA polymerase sigma factor [Bacteroidetes bacterium]|nr:sigma-70 family RNA polymerase sigma factor [Bacteroidota bacterium]
MGQRTMSDQELVQLYLTGQEKALAVLIARHQDKLFSAIYVLVRNRAVAEDILQDAYFKIVSTLKGGRYNEEGKFIQWAMRIARNLVIDHFRRGNKFPTVTDSEGNDIFTYINIPEENQEDRLVANERDSKLRQLIEQLPAEQREVLVLRHYADLSFKEIADLTQVSINTALGRMRYALNNLRKLIEKHNIAL